MLRKLLGTLLLVVAVLLLFKVFFKLLGLAFSFLVVLLGLTLAAVLIFLGWRLFRR